MFKKLKKDDLICRFVIDGNDNKIGESIALDGDILIVKSKNKFLGIPLKHVEDVGKALKVRGLINYDKAEEMGEEWYRRNGGLQVGDSD